MIWATFRGMCNAVFTCQQQHQPSNQSELLLAIRISAIAFNWVRFFTFSNLVRILQSFQMNESNEKIATEQNRKRTKNGGKKRQNEKFSVLACAQIV